MQIIFISLLWSYFEYPGTDEDFRFDILVLYWFKLSAGYGQSIQPTAILLRWRDSRRIFFVVVFESILNYIYDCFKAY